MKKITYFILFVACLAFTACNKDELNPKSIFDTEAPDRDAFDNWLYFNYTIPYNIQFNYKYVDRESDNTYNLVPAEREKSIVMAKVIKYLWLESYDELLGEHFMRQYAPRMVQLIGSKAFNSQGSVVLGTAEGGQKITLYNVNELNIYNLSIDFLNTWFFHTMHHEFCHILHQTKNYSTDFNLISTDYQGPSWVNLDDSEAHQMGFVTAYASSAPDEDFVEIISCYITSDETYWDSLLAKAGTEGAVKLEAKIRIVREYLQSSWNIDLDKLRDIVQRRSGEITKIDLDTL